MEKGLAVFKVQSDERKKPNAILNLLPIFLENFTE